MDSFKSSEHHERQPKRHKKRAQSSIYTRSIDPWQIFINFYSKEIAGHVSELAVFDDGAGEGGEEVAGELATGFDAKKLV